MSVSFQTASLRIGWIVEKAVLGMYRQILSFVAAALMFIIVPMECASFSLVHSPDVSTNTPNSVEDYDSIDNTT